MNRTLSRQPASAAVVTCSAAVAQQQPLSVPRPSPNASISQRSGLTEITLHYSRPGVKGRAIWGRLVPYNEVWRTGANENTTIPFSTPVKVEGHELPAGIYGLQTIPTAERVDGHLQQGRRALGRLRLQAGARRPARPGQARSRPISRSAWASNSTDVTDTSAKVVLRWEKLQVPFKVEVDTPKLVAEAGKTAMRWQNGLQAANYCIQNNTCLDEAGRWIDASIALDANFANQRAKALLLAKKNDFKGAAAAGEKALAAAKSAAAAAAAPAGRGPREVCRGVEDEEVS